MSPRRAACLLIGVFAGCSIAQDAPRVTIGSKSFTESVVLGELGPALHPVRAQQPEQPQQPAQPQQTPQPQQATDELPVHTVGVLIDASRTEAQIQGYGAEGASGSPVFGNRSSA